MTIIVQKYDSTFVESVERIQAVAQHLQKTVKKGNAVVVVVSAMSNTTNSLVNLAKEISYNPSLREMDMLLSTREQVSIALLSMALHELGQSAISLTGFQVGIITTAEHNQAEILQVNTERIQRHLNQGQVVVVAASQGISGGDNWEITTLGAGGGNISALALAASLEAKRCEIYIDVSDILKSDRGMRSAASPGFKTRNALARKPWISNPGNGRVRGTADSSIESGLELITEISADKLLESAGWLEKVLHPRVVEMARNYDVPLLLLSSRSETSIGNIFVKPMKQFI